MLTAAACVLFSLEQAFLIGGAATGMPAPFTAQHGDAKLQKVEAASAPYQVALVYRGYNNAHEGYFCAGSLIDPQWVLTAAHCLSAHTKPSDLKIAVGSAKLSQSKLLPAMKIVRHRAFDRNSMVNDIALIKLSVAIHDMQPVSLADFKIERQALDSAQRAIVSGWGSSAFRPKTISDDLLYVTVPIISQGTCSKNYNSGVTDKMICAGGKNADACSGDSGGGLVMSYKDHRYLEGIVSWGENCGDRKKPGVYTRVPSYLDWIKTHMK